MSFYRTGTSAARANERDLPYIVEMAVPVDGFAHPLRTAMESFHQVHKIRARFGRRIRRDGKEYCRWCFAAPELAELFHLQFGGERLALDDADPAAGADESRGTYA